MVGLAGPGLANVIGGSAGFLVQGLWNWRASGLTPPKSSAVLL
jgi:hypothetical protein